MPETSKLFQNISPQAEAWRCKQLGKSRFERIVERVLAIRMIETMLCNVYGLLSVSRQECLMRWLGE